MKPILAELLLRVVGKIFSPPDRRELPIER